MNSPPSPLPFLSLPPAIGTDASSVSSSSVSALASSSSRYIPLNRALELQLSAIQNSAYNYSSSPTTPSSRYLKPSVSPSPSPPPTPTRTPTPSQYSIKHERNIGPEASMSYWKNWLEKLYKESKRNGYNQACMTITIANPLSHRAMLFSKKKRSDYKSFSRQQQQQRLDLLPKSIDDAIQILRSGTNSNFDVSNHSDGTLYESIYVEQKRISIRKAGTLDQYDYWPIEEVEIWILAWLVLHYGVGFSKTVMNVTLTNSVKSSSEILYKIPPSRVSKFWNITIEKYKRVSSEYKEDEGSSSSLQSQLKEKKNIEEEKEEGPDVVKIRDKSFKSCTQIAKNICNLYGTALEPNEYLVWTLASYHAIKQHFWIPLVFRFSSFSSSSSSSSSSASSISAFSYMEESKDVVNVRVYRDKKDPIPSKTCIDVKFDTESQEKYQKEEPRRQQYVDKPFYNTCYINFLSTHGSCSRFFSDHSGTQFILLINEICKKFRVDYAHLLDSATVVSKVIHKQVSLKLLQYIKSGDLFYGNVCRFRPDKNIYRLMKNVYSQFKDMTVNDLFQIIESFNKDYKMARQCINEEQSKETISFSTLRSYPFMPNVDISYIQGSITLISCMSAKNAHILANIKSINSKTKEIQTPYVYDDNDDSYIYFITQKCHSILSKVDPTTKISDIIYREATLKQTEIITYIGFFVVGLHAIVDIFLSNDNILLDKYFVYE